MKTASYYPVHAIVWRECVRFARQGSRVIGAIGMPLLFWFLIGSGVGRSFQSPHIPEGMGYLEFLFPGTLALILMMTAIFSTISVILDREGGFLQSVLVAPVAATSLVGGKMIGGTLLALLQAFLLLLMSPLIGVPYSAGLFASGAVTLALFSAAMIAFSFLFAWKINSIQGYHGVMNLLLFPMWVLSGAIFPPAAVPAWLRTLMYLNPVTYGVAAIRQAVHPAAVERLGGPSLAVSWLVLCAMALAGFALAVGMVRKEGRK